MSDQPNNEVVRKKVRERYAEAALNASAGCCSESSCCGNSGSSSADLGYSPEELATLPKGVDMGLGSGNPTAIADLKEGEVVLDLGSGGGIDCFLAARKTGPKGRVIGVDMTPEMVEKARSNAAQAGLTNVEFRLGEIEHIPVPDNSIDVIISNCVINLSPDKPAVFRDALRALKPGGRIAVSDIIAREELPESVRCDMDMMCGCISGAADIAEIERMLAEAGFVNIKITPNEESDKFIREWAEGGVENYVTAASIEAVKPVTT